MATSATSGASGSSQERLLASAKRLFSERGYENTSTAMIAREAHTSESQLVKHFGGKEGLLEAIFDEGWLKLEEPFKQVEGLTDRRQKLRATLELFLKAFDEDPLLKELMLLEAKRVRHKGTGVMLTRGYERFLTKIDSILQEMADAGELQAGISPVALRSALIGMLEGMLRDQLLYQKVAHGNFPAGKDAIRNIFAVVMRAVTR